MDTFNAGMEIHNILEELYKLADIYRQEASESLPKGLFTMRDSMIAVDKEVAESLTVDNGKIGVANKQ